VNRRDLVNAVATHTGRERRDVDEVLRGFTDVVTAVVSRGEPVAISGFAKFVKVDRPARMGRNPQTGEPVRIRASKKARITPLKSLKDAVVTPGQAPKLARGTWPPAPAGAKAAKAAKATKAEKATKAAKATKAGKAAKAAKAGKAAKAAKATKAGKAAKAGKATKAAKAGKAAKGAARKTAATRKTTRKSATRSSTASKG
jgi:DNA-binding protein HU-beta